MSGFSITTDSQIRNNSVRIFMSGRFVFEAHTKFKNAYLALLNDASVLEIELEMSKVSYVDCSGLGMLMLLNDRATATNKSVTLLNVCSGVSEILEIANFSKIFTIKNQVDPD